MAYSMLLKTIVIDTNELREREMWSGDFEVIAPLLDDEMLENPDMCETVLERVCDIAARLNKNGRTDFAEAFDSSRTFDDIWEEINEFIDSYIQEKAKEVIAEMKHKELEPEEDDGSFTYMGYRFTPYKQLRGGQLNIQWMSKRTSYEDVFLTTENGWNYDDFYKAAGKENKSVDLFRCNGKVWIPGEHVLFKWIGDED